MFVPRNNHSPILPAKFPINGSNNYIETFAVIFASGTGNTLYAAKNANNKDL